MINCAEDLGCSSDGGEQTYKVIREEIAEIGYCRYPSVVIEHNEEIYHYDTSWYRSYYIPGLKLTYAMELINADGSTIKELYRYDQIDLAPSDEQEVSTLE